MGQTKSFENNEKFRAGTANRTGLQNLLVEQWESLTLDINIDVFVAASQQCKKQLPAIDYP